ncbi:MAG: haloacid dehalogenase type II [Roseinatronobacter sp.]|nr:haloacid dehalogenase type II [Roseinatronobacter sp.]
MALICVFDAYGTLFDVDAAARESAVPRDLWPRLAAQWRRKQLEYTWLRTVAGAHVDFWHVTQDALDWALELLALDDPALRAELLALYRRLAPYPEVPAVLAQLRARGLTLAILSNGARGMLADAVASAGFDGVFDAVLSVDAVGAYKPAPAVYDLVGAEFGCAPRDVLFISANGWDICSGAAYGFRTLWLNRSGAPGDRLHGAPEAEARDMTALLPLIERL